MPDLCSVAREAARVAGLRASEGIPVDGRLGKLSYVAGYLDGFTECASRIPDRETIAEALWSFPINGISLARLSELAKTGEGDYQETLDYLYEQADAVLALIESRIAK